MLITNYKDLLRQIYSQRGPCSCPEKLCLPFLFSLNSNLKSVAQLSGTSVELGVNWGAGGSSSAVGPPVGLPQLALLHCFQAFVTLMPPGAGPPHLWVCSLQLRVLRGFVSGLLLV